MPTRASTPNSASVFKRPSAKLRSVSLLESTPVLFRLPGIEPVQVAAQDVETPASPSSALPVVPLPVAPAIPSPPSVVASSAVDAVTRRHDATTTSSAEPSAASPTARPVAPAVETQAVVHSERSWWEHWSSGVVLILLIIALVAASIMAFNDRGGSSPGPLADASQPAHEVVVDLSKIKIPTLPEAELPVARMATADLSNKSSTSTGNNSSPAASPEVSRSGPAPQLATPSGVLESEQPTTSLVLGVDIEPLADVPLATSPSAVEQPGAANLGGNLSSGELATTKQQITPSDSLAAQPTASLDLPIGLSPPELFSSPEFSSRDRISALATSNSVPKPAESRSPVDAPPTIPELPTPGGAASPSSTGGQPFDTGLPTYPAILTGNENGPSTTPQAAQTSTPEATVQPTATPDSSAEETIRAWQRYHAIHQSEVRPANRYPQSGTPLSTGPEQYPAPTSNPR